MRDATRPDTGLANFPLFIVSSIFFRYLADTGERRNPLFSAFVPLENGREGESRGGA